jgi:Leucine-rich repeat (LRR) protein
MEENHMFTLWKKIVSNSYLTSIHLVKLNGMQKINEQQANASILESDILAAEARRQAISYVINDDEIKVEVEGNFEKQRLERNDKAESYSWKKREPDMNIEFYEKEKKSLPNQWHLGSSSELSDCDGNSSMFKGISEVSDSQIEIRTELEDVEAYSKFSPPTTIHLRGQNVLPGAYRAGGNNSLADFEEPDFMEDIESELSMNEDQFKRNNGNILICAELVPSFADPALPQVELLVEAQPLPTLTGIASIMEVLKKNRKFQLFILLLIFLVVAMTTALITTVDNSYQGGPIPESLNSPTFTSNSLVTFDRFLVDLLKSKLSISSLDRLRDKTSPQFKAAKWLNDDERLKMYSKARILQRFSLATFFFSTGGPTSWVTKDRWLSSSHECTWFSASPISQNICKNGTLKHLYMQQNGLGGSLPEEMYLLSDLAVLSFQANTIGGKFTNKQFHTLSKVETIDFTANLFTGTIPTEIGLITSLRILHLGQNGFKGTLPSELGLLTSVTALTTFHNKISGSIPSEVGALSLMQLFLLGSNKLSGSIPSEVGCLSNLTDFSLETNLLNGSIPKELSRLSQIQMLELQRNLINGTLPGVLGKLSQLQRFDVGRNLLMGEIPDELMGAIKLTFLSLYENNLKGTIPTEVGKLVNLQELYLDSNKISGTIPSELGSISALHDVWVDKTLLQGIVPEEVCALDSKGSVNMIFDCKMVNCSCN